MRTAFFLVAGLLLLAGFVLLGRLFSAGVPIASRVALAFYIALWFVIAALNLWVGVSRAGYTVGDELPIFLLIFGVPAAAAAGLLWRLS